MYYDENPASGIDNTKSRDSRYFNAKSENSRLRMAWTALSIELAHFHILLPLAVKMSKRTLLISQVIRS